MNTAPSRFIVSCLTKARFGFSSRFFRFMACLALFALFMATPGLAPSALAANLYVIGGGGGGGGEYSGGGGGGASGERTTSPDFGGGGDSSGTAGGGSGGGVVNENAPPGLGGGGGGSSSSSTGTNGDGKGGNGGSNSGGAAGVAGTGDGGSAGGTLTPGGDGASGYTGGGGGGGGGGASGDASGDAAGSGGNGTTYSTSVSGSYETLYISGGEGGGGKEALSTDFFAGGGGGGGGNVKVNASGALSVDNLTVLGGTGGAGTQHTSGVGGQTSGAGGSGGSENGKGGGGGAGGSATLNAAGQTVTVTSTVTVSSGGSSWLETHSGSGVGGDVSVTVGALSAPTINLTKNMGALAFTVTNLEIGSAFDTSLTATNLGMGDASITNLLLTGNKNFTITGQNVSVGQLNIDGGTLNTTNWTSLVDGGISYSATDAITLLAGGATVDLGSGDDKTLSRVLTGAGSLTKTGAGTLTLSGANTYSGGTTVTAGTLAGSIAANTDLTVASGATYDGTGAARTVNVLSGAGDITNGSGLTVQSGAFGGVISGTGSLTKTGAGTLTLSGANTYSGGTTVTAGTLAGNTTSLQGTITNNAQVEFNQTGAGIYAGVMDGTGSLTKTGAGTLTLSGANTYSGMTEVRAGALALSGSGRISDKLALYDGTIFTAGGASFSLSQLDVRGSATYTGDLNTANGIMNFYVPTTLSSGATMLTVTGNADIGGSSVNVGIAGGSSPLQVGNQVVLIDAATLTGAPANTTANGRGMQGVTLLYEFDILADSDSDKLFATVSSIGVNPQLKSLSEGRVAGHAFLNQGSDLMLGSGMGAMLAATQGTTQSPTQGGFAPFAAGSGGWSRYNTGSHVDVSGASIMTGLAWRQPVNEGKNGSFLAGAFFEAGWGNYDSHNSFSNAASVKGDGDISYYGGGILGRYDFAPAIFMNGSGNFYVDASFRAGHVSTDFSSSDLIDNAGRKADYDSGSAYYGVHAGLGYLWNITESASLDLSTRYIWTRQDSDTVKVLDDPVRFKAVDSQRWRTGARFAYAVNEYIAPYAGAYYDHEFDGKAKASTYGYAIDAPDLTGGTGVGELGFTLKPSQTLPLSFDLGVQGYTGVREGVTGSFQAKWEF